jgi:hypothetical protein
LNLHAETGKEIMAAALDATATIAALDAEIEQVRISADAETSLDAVSASGNPFAGANERLTALEDERLQLELRAKGEALAKALTEFMAVNGEISELGAKYRATQETIKALKSEPVIIRWMAAAPVSKRLGVSAMWSAVASFLGSEAPWNAYPLRVGDSYTAQLPANLRFVESERDVIRKFVGLENEGKQLSWMFTLLMKRREKFMQLHPALRSLPASAAQGGGL